jgi:hypothetical protein
MLWGGGKRMAEYIKREALLKAYLDLALAKSKAAKARKGAAAFQGDLFPMVELTEKEWVRLINAAPTADVVEVKHGRWVHDERMLAVCLECGMTAVEDGTDYCPNCGAKMDGDEDG